MTPIFIRTDACLIDLAKVTAIKISETGRSTVRFAGGETITISNHEADTIFLAMAHLTRSGVVVAHDVREKTERGPA